MSLEFHRWNDDFLGQPLNVTLRRLGVAWDRTYDHLVHPGVTVALHFVQANRRANAGRYREV